MNNVHHHCRIILALNILTIFTTTPHAKEITQIQPLNQSSLTQYNTSHQPIANILPNGVVQLLNTSHSSAPSPAPEMSDPDLKAGFPVAINCESGFHRTGPAVNIVVGNIDAEPNLEIVVSGLSVGPLYALNHNGTLVPGWPVQSIVQPWIPSNLQGGPRAGYAALGKINYKTISPQRLGKSLSNTLLSSQAISRSSDPVSQYPKKPYFDVVVNWFGGGLYSFGSSMGGQNDLSVYDGNGTMLPGWPRNSASFLYGSPSLAHISGTTLDEIFTEESDGNMHAYYWNNSILPGWPSVATASTTHVVTPAIGDLDGDGIPEIVTISQTDASGAKLYAYHRNGSVVAGYPLTIGNSPGLDDMYPVIGNVDNDPTNEIIFVRKNSSNYEIVIVSNGAIERQIALAGTLNYPNRGNALALANLDNNNRIYIIAQTENTIEAYDGGTGSIHPGFPISLGTDFRLGNAAPVVGDVNGDGWQDIVVALPNKDSGSNFPSWTGGELRVYNHNGTLLPNFPKPLPLGWASVPAIADLDRDGRNDIIVMSDYWDGTPGTCNQVWAYTVATGTQHHIEWGQFGGGPQHQGFYPAP